MTYAPPPVDDRTPARMEPPVDASLRLGYATPRAANDVPDLSDYILMVVRRLLFALGTGRVTFGLVHAIDGGQRGDAGSVAGLGAGLVALVIPFRKLAETPRLGRRD